MSLTFLVYDEIYFSCLMHINDLENPILLREKYFFTNLVISAAPPLYSLLGLVNKMGLAN